MVSVGPWATAGRTCSDTDSHVIILQLLRSTASEEALLLSDMMTLYCMVMHKNVFLFGPWIYSTLFQGADSITHFVSLLFSRTLRPIYLYTPPAGGGCCPLVEVISRRLCDSGAGWSLFDAGGHFPLSVLQSRLHTATPVAPLPNLSTCHLFNTIGEGYWRPLLGIRFTGGRCCFFSFFWWDGC